MGKFRDRLQPDHGDCYIIRCAPFFCQSDEFLAGFSSLSGHDNCANLVVFHLVAKPIGTKQKMVAKLQRKGLRPSGDFNLWLSCRDSG